MANDAHVAQLMKGVAAWNARRHENIEIFPDLRGANLSGEYFAEAILNKALLGKADLSRANLSGSWLTEADLTEANLSEANLSGTNLSRAYLTCADLRGANLRWANLSDAYLTEAHLEGANLSRADLRQANVSKANVSKANLSKANLSGADFDWANLSGADLNGANLWSVSFVETDLTGADLTACRIHGVSVWAVKLVRAKQQNLVITREDEPEITVDNIEVAQFVYLLLHNKKIRDVIDTIGKKGVLLLGRFTDGRVVVLERLRDKLRDLGYVPMVFNFDKPQTKDFTETVRLLCNLSHFVIVDITNPRSAPLELQANVPDYMVPFVPILQDEEEPFAMFVDLQNKYDWVLKPVISYPTVDRLIEVLEDEIVRPAEAKFDELLLRRTEKLRVKKV